MQTLGVITNNQHAVFQSNIIAGVREIAAAHNLSVVVDSLAEGRVPRRPVSLDLRALEGVVVIADVLSENELRALYEQGKPITLVSHYLPHLPIPAVISNNARGMQQLVQHVIERCGRRRFVYIRGEPTQRDSIEREMAFVDELIRHQLPDAYLLRGDFDPDVAVVSLQALIDQKAVFDAVVAADYRMGAAVLEVLERAGYRVPQDVSVTGFGDGVEAETHGLTTVAANVIEQGRRAARQVIGQTRGLTIRGLTVLNTELVLRRTCCP
jgi:LacI family transcriptional regulator